jgi:hypothetical protein
MTVQDVHQALRDADTAVAKAKAERDEAVKTLERVLAEIGWTRLPGAFSSTAPALYNNALYPDARLDIEGLLKVLKQLARAAA